jgi:hypothetical protein
VGGTQFSCFTGTKVQILTLAGEQVGVGGEREGSVRRAPSVGGVTTVAAVRARCVTYADVR